MLAAVAVSATLRSAPDGLWPLVAAAWRWRERGLGLGAPERVDARPDVAAPEPKPSMAAPR